MSLIGNGSVIQPVADTPAHSNVDEEDFSGVVEAPMLKVKEIRARYKVRDYEDYAKPKATAVSRHSSEECQTNRKTSSTFSDGLNEDSVGNREVSQQVMGLFKGALDFEKELAIYEQEKTSMHRAKPSPVKHTGHVTTVIKSSNQQDNAKETPVQVRHTPGKLKNASWPPVAPVEENDKKDIKESVRQIKSETEAVTSFDESLDQFYDVLNDLSLS